MTRKFIDKVFEIEHGSQIHPIWTEKKVTSVMDGNECNTFGHDYHVTWLGCVVF